MHLHPTGPLWGAGSPETRDAAFEFEIPRGAEEKLLADGLEQNGASAARRSTRLKVGDLTWSLGGNALTIRFRLGRGAFATTVLREVLESTTGTGRETDD